MYRAAVLTKPRNIDIQSREALTLDAKEVLIEVSYAGVCGTDIAIFTGNYEVSLPLVLGHEFSGKVARVGSEASRELIGKSVTAEINNTCLARGVDNPCAFCSKGLSNHCTSRTVLGIDSWDGAFAEMVKVPAGSIHIIPEGISLKKAVFIEPLAAAIQTFELSKLEEKDTVAVLGVGRLGLLVCAVAKALGGRVIAISRSREKLDRALMYGVDEVIDASSEDVKGRTHSLTQGMGATIVVEATGSPSGVNLALELVQPRGVIAMKTTSGVLTENLDTTKLVVDEIRLQGSRCGPFEKAIALLDDGKVDPEHLVSEILPLEETAKAIELAKGKTKVLIKAL